MGARLLNEVIAGIDKAATTLLFTNTRSQAELWYRSLVEKRFDWLTEVSLHHGSIDCKLRTRVERAPKTGELFRVVCTSSLDLGVDFPKRMEARRPLMLALDVLIQHMVTHEGIATQVAARAQASRAA